MAFQTGHALLIGVGTYQNVSRLDVPVTAADAQELATVLQDPQYCGYPQEQVTFLHDDTATRDGILAALDQLAQKTTEGDTVLLFYSGHGELGADGETYHLTTYDMQKDAQRKVVDGTALRQDELLTKLREIKAKRLILLFNACHSGEISPVLDGEAAADLGEGAKSLPDSTAAAILATGEGRIIITACREQQFSFVGSGPHTIFTQALLDGLRGKGTNSNGGFISAFDLYTSIYYAVDRAVQKIPLASRQQFAGGVQQPELTVLKGIGPMPVALYKGQSATLSDFNPNEQLDTDTVVSQIDKKYSDRMLRSHVSVNTNNSKAVGGDSLEAGRDAIKKNAGGDMIEAGGNVSKVTGDIVGGHKIAGDYVGGDKFTGDKVAGNKIDARGAQGFIYGATGPINQRNVSTGGGDYAEGTIDKRTSYGAAGAPERAVITLEDAYQQVTRAVEQYRARGEEDLADQLQAVELTLKSARRAQTDGNATQAQAKLSRARQDLQDLVDENPGLRELSSTLQQVQ